MPSKHSRKGKRSNKKGGFSLTKGYNDIIDGTFLKDVKKGVQNLKHKAEEKLRNKKESSFVPPGSSFMPTTESTTESVETSGGRHSRRRRRRRRRHHKGGTGTYKDITAGAEGATPLQAIDYNNDATSSGTPWGGSESKPWGNAWNSWALGPTGGGPNPSWGAPINPSNIKFSIGGGRTHPKKGQKSRTMKNKKDFTTKKRTRLFNANF